MQKTKLLFMIDSLAHDAGTEIQVSELARRIDRAQFEIHLGCFEPSDRLRQLSQCCHTAVFPLDSLYRIHSLRQIAWLQHYIRHNKIDIVHTFMVKATIAGVAAARAAGCRVILSSRRNLGYWQTPAYLRLFRLLNSITSRALANSEGAKRTVVETEGIAEEKVDVLYNGVDTSRFGPQQGNPTVAMSLGIPPEAKVVGMVANLRPVKDPALFLRAAKVVAEKVPEAAFLLVGLGPLRGDLAQLATDLGIASRVFFSDGVGTVADHLRRLSIGCLTSKSEGFSNAVLEYMAGGLPVVATDVGGNREAIDDGVTGYLVTDRTPEALATPIITLLRDEPRRAAMGRRSRQRCLERFDIRRIVRQHEDYYRALVNRSTD